MRDLREIRNDSHSAELNPYFHFDPQSKQIKDSVFNCRGIIINERFWNRIRNELMDLTKEAGPVILYQLGLSYGLEVGTKGKEAVKDSTAAISFLEYYGLLAGWGRFETSKLRIVQGRLSEPVVVRIFDNFFAHTYQSNSGNPSCFFVAGLLAGISDGLFGGHHNCLEEECISAGSESCKFVVAKASSLY
ncbi:MAG: V4R domain-containing protein [Nitrososphaera sp.]